MRKIKNLRDHTTKELIWPRTHMQAVIDDQGRSVTDRLDSLKYAIDNVEVDSAVKKDSFINFKTEDEFYAKKLSADETNTTFRLGKTGIITSGTPEILWDDFCFIEDIHNIWHKGVFYGVNDQLFSDLFKVNDSGKITIDTVKLQAELAEGGEDGASLKDYIDSKVGAIYYNPVDTTLYMFKDDAAKQSWMEAGYDPFSEYVQDKAVFEFQNVTYLINIKNNNNSNILYFSNDAYEAVLSLTPSTQQRKLTESEWSTLSEDYRISVAYDKHTTGNWEDIVVNQTLVAGEAYTLDVLKLISSTASRFRVTIEGVSSKQVTQFIYSATLTSMYLKESNFNWYTPYIQGTPFRVGGLLIGGSLSKTLYIKITNGEAYNITYNVNIGLQTFTNTPYFFEGLRFPETGTGVYNLEIWLDAGSVQSEHLYYNILCVAEDDISTAQLVAVSNNQGTAINYYDNHLFDFAIYNKGVSNGNVTVDIYNVVHAIPSLIGLETLYEVPTSVSNAYVKNIEIDSEETDMSILVNVGFGNELKLSFVLDNAYNFPPTSGAKFYLNPSSRSNTQENRESVINAATSSGDSELETVFNRITWADGADGWTTDNDGRKCLRLPATTSCDFAYPLFDNVTNGRAIELTFKAENVSDYTKPIIYCCDNPNSDLFLGIKIFPTKVVVHSSQLNTTNYDPVQSYSFKDEEIVHMIIAISYGYKSLADWNICAIYVNGVKKCEFAFSGNDNWLGSKFTHFGSDYADLFVYNMRVYGQSFGFSNTLTNHVNSLNSLDARITMSERNTSVVNDDWDIDIDKVRDVANYAIIEITEEGELLPGYGLSKEYTTWCNWEQHYHDNPEWDFKITDGKLSGQGTTSMNYYWWNLRVRTDESTEAHPTSVTYLSNPIMALDGEIDTPVKLCGDKYPGVYRITAKKNYASSMQSHKMGATAAFNDLHDAVVGKNEANGRTALYQYPFYVFLKIRIESADAWIYKFVGLYTIGPDKGDKPTYGYNKAEVKNDLLVLEGIDHNKQLAIFKYPWDDDKVTYVAEDKALAIIKNNDTYESGWEASVTGSAKTAEAIETKLKTLWKPAYDVAYKNSPFILPIDLTKENLDVLTTADWRIRKTPEGHSYERYEVWLSSTYELYYYDVKDSRYKPSGVNVLTDLGLTESDVAGMTLEEKNQLFIQKRCERFYNNWKTYYHEDDTIFHYTWCFIFGATDNYAKNSYPYILGTFENGYKWRWRQDDLDTIFDIDNQGHSVKTYSIEPDDWSSKTKTAYVYKGEDSALWTLIRMTCQKEINKMGKNILAAMYSLGGTKLGTSTYARIVGFFHKYFWDNAQDYFTKSAYNVDAELIYEDAYPDYKSGKYKVDVSPLQQLLGDHYEAERAWVEKRIIYCMSRFNYGPFVEYSDSCLGIVSFRTQNQLNLEVTPAIDMYPAVISGAGTIVSSPDRINAGSPIQLNGVGGTNTNVYILAADWIQDLGDLRRLLVDSESATPLNIGLKRLETLKLGDSDASTVTCNIQNLVVGNSPSLSKVDCRNVSSLTGSLDFSGAPRLTELYLGGTDVRSLIIANGARIKTIELPPNIALINFNNLKYLETGNYEANTGLMYDDLSHIRTLRLENCYSLNEFQMLKDCYNAGNTLTSIRVVGFNYEGDLSDIDILANIKNGIDCNGNPKKYDGIDANGNIVNTSIPIIEGTIDLKGGAMYRDSYEDISNYFYNLDLSIEGGFFTRIKDPYIKAILLNAGLGNENNDIHENTLATVNNTNLNAMFNSTLTSQLIKDAKENAESFDELHWFKNISTLTSNSLFANYAKLKSVTLPMNMTSTKDYMFDGCHALTDVKFNEGLKTIAGYTFRNCDSLTSITLPSTLTTLTNNAFVFPNEAEYRSHITKLNFKGTDELWCNNVNLGGSNASPLGYYDKYNDFTEYCIYSSDNTPKMTFTIPNNAIQISQYKFLNFWHVSFENLNRNSALQTIGTQAFKNCKAITGELHLRNLTKLDNNAFNGCTGITSIELPALLAGEDYVFQNCTALKTANMISLQTTKNGYFDGCTSLESVNLPNLNATSGSYMFRNCSSLKSISLPKYTDYIRTSMFEGCSLLETINAPQCMQVNGSAFKNCYNLKNVILGHGISYTSGNCFENCRSLEYLETTCRHMAGGTGMFNGCTSLREITFHDGCQQLHPQAFSQNDSIIDGNGLGWTPNNTSTGAYTTIKPGFTANFGDCVNTNVELANTLVFCNSVYRIIVPDETYDWYRTNTIWNRHMWRVFPKSEYDKQPVLNYIEFSGSQYYDTGIHADRYLKFEIFFEMPYAVPEQMAIFGTRDYWNKTTPEHCGPETWELKFEGSNRYLEFFCGSETSTTADLYWQGTTGRIAPTAGHAVHIKGGYDDGFEYGGNKDAFTPSSTNILAPSGMRRIIQAGKTGAVAWPTQFPKEFATSTNTIWLGACENHGLISDLPISRTAKIFFFKLYHTYYWFDESGTEYRCYDDALAAATAAGVSAENIQSRDEYIADFRPTEDGRFKNLITNEFIENVGPGEPIYGEY